jgi:cell division protein FtsI/penicillin-binding protein 2
MIFLVAVFACLISLFLLLLSTPALASEPVYGPGNSIMAVICVETNNTYKGFIPHYNDHFPPGSTVKIYVEASGKTTKNDITGEYKPSIQFKMTGTRPTGATFTASTSSSKMINHDKTPHRKDAVHAFLRA